MQMLTLFANIRQRTDIKREKIVQMIKSQAARGIFPFVLSLSKDLISASLSARASKSKKIKATDQYSTILPMPRVS